MGYNCVRVVDWKGGSMLFLQKFIVNYSYNTIEFAIKKHKKERIWNWKIWGQKSGTFGVLRLQSMFNFEVWDFVVLQAYQSIPNSILFLFNTVCMMVHYGFYFNLFTTQKTIFEVVVCFVHKSFCTKYVGWIY